MSAIRYGTEPFDMRLFLKHVVSNIGYLISGTLLGGLIIGGIYYLVNVTLDFSDEYRVVCQYYVEYKQDPYTEVANMYYNEETWNMFIQMDAFLDDIMENTTYTKEELIDAIYIDILSDVRVLTVSVTTPDEALTESMAQALLPAFVTFGQEQDVVQEIVLLDRLDPELVIEDVRPFRALMLGVFIGFFVSLAVFVFQYFWRDEVEAPRCLRRRYRIPVLGSEHGEELFENMRYACRNSTRVGIVCIGTELDSKNIAEQLAIADCEYVPVPCMALAPESARILRELNGAILIVKQGKDTIETIDGVVSFYMQQEVKVLGFVLWNE